MLSRKWIICALPLAFIPLTAVYANKRTAEASRLTSRKQAPKDLVPEKAKARKDFVETYYRLPLSFEPEPDGQGRSFVARGSGYSMLLESNRATFGWVPVSKRPPIKKGSVIPPSSEMETKFVSMQLENTKPLIPAEGMDKQTGTSSYFIGGDPTRWRTGVEHYGKVRFADVYAGIDVVYYGNQRRLEYDFVVKPGARPSDIQLAWTGVNGVRLDSNGDLVLSLDSGEFRQLRPHIYQTVGGKNIEVAGAYKLLGGKRIGFEVAGYDRRRPLVIDPILSFASYLGGNSTDEAATMTLDNAGNIYVGGRTLSVDFRRSVTSPAFQTSRKTGANGGSNFDGYLAKLNPTGSAILYSTFIGGTDYDIVQGITVDGNQTPYFSGETLSGSRSGGGATNGNQGDNFPANGEGAQFFNAGGQDGFATKLNSSAASLDWSSYLGAQSTDSVYAMLLSGGAVIGVGRIGDNIMLTRWNSTAMGTPQVVSFGGSGVDYALDAAIGPGGNLYLTGATFSSNVPNSFSSYNGGGDAFWARFTPTLQASVFNYLGSDGFEEGRGIAVTTTGEVLITGEAQSSRIGDNTYGKNGLAGDAFVARYNNAGALSHFGYFGGSLRDFGDTIAVDSLGTAYVGGFTQSSDFPVGPFSPAKQNGGNFDVFVMRVATKSTGIWNLLFSAYFGAAGGEGVSDIVLGPTGSVYMSGTAGQNSNGTNPFPSSSANPSLQTPAFGGDVDSFVAQLASAKVNFTLRRTFGPPPSSGGLLSRSPDNYRVFNTLDMTNTSSTQAENCGTNTSSGGTGGLGSCPNCTNVPGLQTVSTVFTTTVTSSTQACTDLPVKTGCETNDTTTAVNDSNLQCPSFNPNECAPAFLPPTLTAAAAGGDQEVALDIRTGCSWNIASDSSFVTVMSPTITSDTKLPDGRQQVRLRVAANATGVARTARVVSSSVSIGQLLMTQPATGGGGVSVSLSPSSAALFAGQTTTFTPTVTGAGNTAVTFSLNPPLGSINGIGQYTAPTPIALTQTVTLTATSVADPTKFATASINLQSGTPSSGLRFVSLAPCRVMETRPEYNFQGRTGVFGPPFLQAGETRTLTLSQSNVCSIPSTAKAYVLNLTLVPRGGVDFVTVWPGGETRPDFWSIRSPDAQVVANSAIVKAGAGGTIQVFSSNTADVLIDISGYMTDSPAVSNLVYYPLTPCRVVETRSVFRPAGAFGPPTMNAGETRRFRFPSATQFCTVPSGASAYSVTITAVPPAALQFLTAWPAGAAQPNVSNINSPAGRVLANNVIIPASSDGSLDVFVFDRTDVVVDINGYYAPDDGVNGLYYFPVTQCRAVDTRLANGTFGGPIFESDASRSYPLTSSPCGGIPANARGYVVNATALPNGSPMPFLTLWPTGQTRPNASTLNAFEGQIVTNTAILPAGPSSSIDVFAFRRTHIVLDVSGFFGR